MGFGLLHAVDRHEQIGPAPSNLGFSVDLVRCSLVLGIIGLLSLH
jgi:hypothetical protein